MCRLAIVVIVLGLLIGNPVILAQSEPKPSQPTPPAKSSTVQPAGYVTINSSIVSEMTSVFPGDELQTGEKSAAKLTGVGHQVVAASNSALVYEGDAIQVGCGAFLVNTVNGFLVRVGDLDIKPSSGQTAVFKVVQSRGKVSILADQGSVSMVRGDTVRLLPIGKTVTEKTTACLNLYAQGQIVMDAIFGSSLFSLLADTGPPGQGHLPDISPSVP